MPVRMEFVGRGTANKGLDWGSQAYAFALVATGSIPGGHFCIYDYQVATLQHKKRPLPSSWCGLYEVIKLLPAVLWVKR